MPETAAPESFCIVCDAPRGGCAHTGHRYLSDIEYLPGPAKGWIVPPLERSRWNAAPLRPDLPRAVQQYEARLENEPFACPVCGRRLFAGKRFCSTACYLKAKAHLT